MRGRRWDANLRSAVGRPGGAAVHERPLPTLGRRDRVPLVDNSVDVVGHVDLIRFFQGTLDELVLEEAVVLRSLKLVLDKAGVDEVDKLKAEVLPVLARIEARGIAVNDLLKLLKHRVPLRVGKLASGHFDESDSEGPDVGSDVVAFGPLRVDPLRRHVRPAAGVASLGDRVNKLQQKIGYFRN